MELPFANRRSLTQAYELAIDVKTSRDLGDLQRRFVRAAAPLVDADLHGIYLFEDGEPRPVTTDTAPRGFLRDYERHGREGDPLLAYLRQMHQPVHERILYSARDWQRVPLGDVMRDWDLEHSLQGPLFVGDRLVGTINFARTIRSRAFGEADVQLAAWLCRQVSDAYERVASQQLAELRGACLDVIAAPVVVTDRNGKVVVANRAAREHLQPFDSSALKPELGAAVAANVAALERGPARLAESRTRPNRPGATGERARTRKLAGSGGYYASTFSPAPRDQSDPGGADTLSPREQQVASLVAEGLTNEQIAAQLVLSTNTVKDQRKVRILASWLRTASTTTKPRSKPSCWTR